MGLPKPPYNVNSRTATDKLRAQMGGHSDSVITVANCHCLMTVWSTEEKNSLMSNVKMTNQFPEDDSTAKSLTSKIGHSEKL